jgi:TetR/AcrR family transcriptional repressor of nem operon
MQKGEKTRKRIIETAAVLFNRVGFEGTSMQDVSAAVGLEKGSLYTHFSSKEDLAREAFDFACAQSFEDSIERIDASASPVEKIRIHIRNLMTKPHYPGGCPMMNIAMLSDAANAVLHRRASDMLAQWVAFVAQLVEDGKTGGQIKGTLDGRAFATLMISLLEGAYLTSMLQKTDEARQIAGQHLLAYLDTFTKPERKIRELGQSKLQNIKPNRQLRKELHAKP